MLTLYTFLSITAAIQAQNEPYVVSNAFVPINSFPPHSAFLAITCVQDDKSYYICGSSILNHKMVLTAAHCLVKCLSETNITIEMGHVQKDKGTVRSASEFAIHAEFNDYTQAYDVGIVKMSQPVELDSKISRVAIMSTPPYRETAMIPGWGIINEETKEQGVFLKKIEETVLEHDECERLVGPLAEGTFCASTNNDANIFSFGDSGAALMVRGYIQIGVLSGNRPTKALHIGIYTDVGYHYDWITNKVQSLYCD